MWGRGATEMWWTRILIVWAFSAPTLTGAVCLPCCFTTPFQWGCSKINSLWQCVLLEANQSLHCPGNIISPDRAAAMATGRVGTQLCGTGHCWVSGLGMAREPGAARCCSLFGWPVWGVSSSGHKKRIYSFKSCEIFKFIFLKTFHLETTK